MKSMVLMQGIPGSGKSTVARSLAVQEHYDSIILSTDDFWYDDKGIYNFDYDRLSEAHQWNQQRTVEAMQQGIPHVFIDNTNIMKWQVEPYLVLASIYGYDVSVVRVEVPVSVAIERQASRPEDRRIPAGVIKSMHDSMEKLL